MNYIVSDNFDSLSRKIASDDYSLESILAEYKGTAFINSEKKTPPELLDLQADKIIREVLGDDIVDSLKGTPPAPSEPTQFETVIPDPAPFEPELFKPAQPQRDIPKTDPLNDTIPFNDPRLLLPEVDSFLDTSDASLFETPERSAKKPPQRPAEEEIPINQFASQLQFEQEMPAAQHEQVRQVAPIERQGSVHDDAATLFANNRPAVHQDTLSSIGFEVQSAIESEQNEVTQFESPIRSRIKSKRELFDDSLESRFDDKFEIKQEEREEEEFIEPPLKDAVKRFVRETNSISLRCVPVVLISVLTVIMTFAFEAGMIMPFGIGRSVVLASGFLVLCQLIVMLLCVDIIVRGFDSLIKGTPGAETLILFSCIFSFVSGIFTLLGGSPGFLPFCAVSCCSLAFALIGEKYNNRAITETLKTACSSSEPYGIQDEYNDEVKKTVIKKAYNRTDGFYTNLMRPDISETGYKLAAPILLVIAMVFAITIIIFRGGSEYFLHVFSAFFAAAAPFSALLSFSIPFSLIVRSGRNLGAAVAGWGGCDDIYFTDGACITDEDLFPPGTMQIYNPKLFSGETLEKAVRYTASIIIESGSGLSRLFSEILRSDNKAPFRVEDFSCAEGGVRGLIRGELVETGSAAFMNLIGVRIPDRANMKNAVYTAINKRLVVVFPIEYTPVNSVQSALISLLKWRINLFLAVRDFNVTPLMLAQKYKVSFDDIELIQARESYTFSDANSGKEGRMTAVIVREGLGPYAEILTGGRLLRSSAMFATILSIISALCGVLLVFYMCWAGAFLSATPGSLIVFMLCMLASVLLVCGYVKCRR